MKKCRLRILFEEGLEYSLFRPAFLSSCDRSSPVLVYSKEDEVYTGMIVYMDAEQLRLRSANHTDEIAISLDAICGWCYL
ncbi:MAG: hypothetical protein J6C15_05570 [Bacteroidaceae bacterium]|nr:hypothetical protein [Bacteroidaceae bacterium]